MLCTVITAERSPRLGEGLLYESGEHAVSIGDLVEVPLRGRIVLGIVIRTREDEPQRKNGNRSYKILPMSRVIAKGMDERTMTVVHWIAEKYCSSLRHALTLLLPSPWTALIPTKQQNYSLGTITPRRLGPKQKAILAALRETPDLPSSSLHTLASSSTIKSLLDQGAIVVREVTGEKEAQPHRQITLPTPSASVQNVLREISSASQPILLMEKREEHRFETFLHLCVQILNEGRQLLLLTPDHTRLRMITTKLRQTLEDTVTLFHADLSAAELRGAIESIASGAPTVIVGTASALGAPLRNLGCVIVDEEHAWLWKSERSPFQNTRDVAVELGKAWNAHVILASDTPSLESWYCVKQGLFHLIDQTIVTRSTPVRIIDLTKVRFDSHYPLSPPLVRAMQDHLVRGERCTLLLNRRGRATSVLCRSCRRRLHPPGGDLPYSVVEDREHRSVLLDPRTHRTIALPDTCHSCGSHDLLEVGAGTEGTERELQKLFPTTSILRVDQDSAASETIRREIIDRLEREPPQILLGTQAILTLPTIPMTGLVAVLLADIGTSLPDFRQHERSLSLMRAVQKRLTVDNGLTMIQTYHPDSPDVRAIETGDVVAFLNAELEVRRALHFPPLTPMVRMNVGGSDPATRAQNLMKLLEEEAKRHTLELTIMNALPILRDARNRWRVLARGRDILKLIREIPLQDCTIDVDPVNVL